MHVTPDKPTVCRVKRCGRPLRARGYCQTHYKHIRLEGRTRPIKRKRAPRREAVRLSGLSLMPDTAAALMAEARRRNLAANAVITDILEAWRKRLRK